MGSDPFVKQIDTLAGEYPAKTNYLYLTLRRTAKTMSDTSTGSKRAPARLGRLPHRQLRRVRLVLRERFADAPGTGVPHPSWSTTTPRRSAPTTMSATGSTSTISAWRRCSTSTNANDCHGVIVSVGGQIPNNLALQLHEHGVRDPREPPRSTSTAPRTATSSRPFSTSIGVDQPPWSEVTSFEAGARHSRPRSGTRC